MLGLLLTIPHLWDLLKVLYIEAMEKCLKFLLIWNEDKPWDVIKDSGVRFQYFPYSFQLVRVTWNLNYSHVLILLVNHISIKPLKNMYFYLTNGVKFPLFRDLWILWMFWIRHTLRVTCSLVSNVDQNVPFYRFSDFVHHFIDLIVLGSLYTCLISLQISFYFMIDGRNIYKRFSQSIFKFSYL